MAKRHVGRDRRLRELVAQEAARVMYDEGVRDFHLAKRKAAQRLGAPLSRNLPSNSEIEEERRRRQELFDDEAAEHVRRLREVAIEALRFLERFQPRLVGSVLLGTAGPHSDINIHAYADAAEELLIFLMERGVPHRCGDRRLRFGDRESYFCPTVSFSAEEVDIEVSVLPVARRTQPPRSNIDGRPMRRASVDELRALLGEQAKPAAHGSHDGREHARKQAPQGSQGDAESVISGLRPMPAGSS